MNSLRLRRARQAARRVLVETALERAKPVPVEQIAKALGVQIVDGELDGALAALTRVGDRARIRVSTRNVYPGQRRFTIAHELGHYVLGHSSAHVCNDPNAAAACDSLQEREADVFASELLMPEQAARRYCEVSPVDLGPVQRLAGAFSTSVVASAIRFAELTSERCAVVLSQGRQVTWAVASQSFWPDIRRGQRLMPWAVADAYFARGDVSADCEAVDASAWISGEHLRGQAELYEHATVLPQLNAVLSLLWIPESCGALAYRAV